MATRKTTRRKPVAKPAAKKTAKRKTAAKKRKARAKGEAPCSKCKTFKTTPARDGKGRFKKKA